MQGTLFVLKKTEDVVDELLVAVRDGQEGKIMALIDKLDKPSAPARSDLIAGKWRLKWSMQSEDANPLQKALVGQVGSPTLACNITATLRCDCLSNQQAP